MEPMKLPQMQRDNPGASVEIRAEKEATRLSFSLSSEAPIGRWFGDEVLSHAKGAIRTERIERGAMPLLFNHNWNDAIGMIESARVEDSRLVVDAKLFDTPRAAEVLKMVEGGLRNVSIGYRVHVFEEEVKTSRYTATDWEPYEGSIVTVPADPTVGIGRDAELFEVRMIRPSAPDVQQPAQAPRGVQVDEKVAAAGASAEVKLSAVEAEKERRLAIVNLCKSNRIDARIEAQWIEDGVPLTQVAREILDVMEERGKAKPMEASRIGMSSKETQRYSLFKAIRALRFGAQNREFIEQAGFEIECSRALAKQLGREVSSRLLVPAEILQRPLGAEAAKRAMATTPGAAGGYLVAVENMGFIDILRNRSVAMNMGARVLSGLQGNVVFPRQTGKVSVTWQAGEHTSVTAADQTLGQLSMTPKTCIAITDVSEQLLAQSSPSAEAFVMADLAADVAIDGVDNSVINGTGGAQPLGIKNTTGVTTGQDAATATYAKILAFPAAAGAVNAIRGNPGFVTNIAGSAILMQRARFANTDTPLWEGNLMDGVCIGFRAMSSQQLASANLIFGSWDEVVIGEWGVLELSTDNGGTRFNTATVGIRAMWMVDVMLRYPQAFVVSVNLS